MSLLGHVLRFLIRVYQYAISPYFPPTCRYMPTCSAYALEAIETHGALKGTWLAVRRFSRCHPLGGWGYDPVPPAEASQHTCHSTHTCKATPPPQ